MSTASDLGVALAPLGVALVKAGIDAIEGKLSREQAARNALTALLGAYPRDELISYLTEGGEARAEVLADVAEAIKFKNT